MSTKIGQQPVNEAVRDAKFSQLRKINDNNICIDCGKKNPKWSSVHIGVYLCIDCAGRHRQYGVIHSFVKSVNLDVWNRKQLTHMEKGGNARALQYFKKFGMQQGQIDYKSGIVKKYKQIITAEVELQINGVTSKQQPIKQKQPEKAFHAPTIEQTKKNKEISNTVEEVQEQQKTTTKTKKNKKKIGKKINLDDFENMIFDGGISAEEQKKMMQENQKCDTGEVNTAEDLTAIIQKPVSIPVQQVKQMTQEESKKKMEELRAKKTNCISSEDFKNVNQDLVKTNINKFNNATSISSSAFFGETETAEDETMDKIKNAVSQTSQKVIGKLSTFWNRLTNMDYDE